MQGQGCTVGFYSWRLGFLGLRTTENLGVHAMATRRASCPPAQQHGGAMGEATTMCRGYAPTVASREKKREGDKEMGR
jgi:hypothetical protein